MKKALMVTSVASMIKQFNMANINILKDMGYEVTVATNFNKPGTIPLDDAQKLYHNLIKNNVKVVDIPFERSILSKNNMIAYNKMSVLMQNEEYNLIHCQSPIGGVITRLIVRALKIKTTKVIYTAHGFHFFKGSPLVNWLYYPVEKTLSNYNNTLITINQEDFERAKKWNTTEVEYIPGIGVDTYKISNTIINKDMKKKEIGVPKNSFLVLSVGEINDRKNHKVVIEALKLLNNPNIHYVICGQGEKEKELNKIIDSYKLSNQVHILGYVNNIEEIYKASDVFVFPSKREGLGLAGIEAMAAGLPIITSNVNGINDYSIDGKTGFKYKYNDIHGFKNGISKIMNLSKDELNKLALSNIKMSRKFDQANINKKMKELYKLDDKWDEGR